MKIHSKNHYTTNNFNEDEIEVSKILVDMPFLITKSLAFENFSSLHRFPYSWNTKKLRSALVSPPPFQPLKLVREASSPTTPLSYSPKRKHQSINSWKDELEAVLKQRMSTQELLKDALEKVKVYRDKLIVENSELKTKKQKLLHAKEREKIMTQVNDQVHAGAPKITENLQQVPLIFHPITGVNDPLYEGPSTSTQAQQHNGPFTDNDPVCAGPSTGFQFDLNIVPEDEHMTMMNVKAMAAAKARQKRIQANKEKKTRGKH